MRTAALATATALSLLLPTTDAHAAAVACGGSVSTQGIAANGCISAERGKEGRVHIRDIKAHVVLNNTRPHAANVEYEAFFSAASDGHWVKIGNGRTLVPRRTTTGPIEIGSTTRACFVVNAKVEIRVHVRPAGGAWSNWTSAATSQCQT
ncbi:hypothetical protein [Streptomyces sp. VRA16 Mangrove soil]|uniref:hypothetical protein n=1 Tax=Streptomyces sp. VRA16 Mangrove soil TaxID=2817434 RepID=UPI001A9DA90D|nr:hypothetical protein [Streptomyces sp. VRA16 Mangrove soil]MBO1332706.1 hypothetical protein [Streptomyces sp. VRA16 Mangrove soil]